MGNKMFVIDCEYLKRSEVYDNVCRKFTTFIFNLPSTKLKSVEVFSANDNIFIFDMDLNLYVYNINENIFSFKGKELNGSLKYAAFQKYPKL